MQTTGHLVSTPAMDVLVYAAPSCWTKIKVVAFLGNGWRLKGTRVNHHQNNSRSTFIIIIIIIIIIVNIFIVNINVIMIMSEISLRYTS